MPDYGKQLGVSKSESNLLVLYIPSADREGRALGKRTQMKWVRRALKALGTSLGGATAFPRGHGVWRDDDRGGELVWDRPVVVQCYTNEEALEQRSGEIRRFLVALGTQTNQGAVGFVIDRDYYEIRFPLRED